MNFAFVKPNAQFFRPRISVLRVCKQSPPPRPVLSAKVQQMAATGYGRSRSKTRDDGYGGNDPESDGEWRRQNSELVLEAEENGVDSSVEMLRSMTRRGNVHVQNFNQVVSLLVSKKRFEDAFRLALEAGQRGMVNTLTFRPLMKNCCANGNGHSAKRVWKAMTEFGVEGDMFLYAELMGALVRSQDMGTAHHVIELLQKSGRRPHVVLYNTLLKGYAKRADVKGGFEVLRTIEDVGIKPDETTFNTLLNVCVRAKDGRSMNKALEQMRRHGVKPGAPTFNTILKLYARVGKFEAAQAIFDEMLQTVEPSIVTFNTLIDGCAHRGDMERASVFFDDMLERGISPDICTMTSLLKGFGRANDPDRAVDLYEAMKEGGFKLEDRTRYAVINACLRGNDRTNARRLVGEMKNDGLRVRSRTWLWLLECDIWADDESSASETLRNLYEGGGCMDSAFKATLMREIRERGGFLAFQRQLKAVRTGEIRD